jgi:Zinc knuckle
MSESIKIVNFRFGLKRDLANPLANYSPETLAGFVRRTIQVDTATSVRRNHTVSGAFKSISIAEEKQSRSGTAKKFWHCYNCQESGHLVRECRNPRQPRPLDQHDFGKYKKGDLNP